MSPLKKHLILVVDDDTDLLETVKDFLVYEGYDVVTAANGEEGLSLLRDRDPDIIILDMNMPGMGGIPFLREMAEVQDRADVPVIVFTARANMAEFFEGMDVAGFVSKPCDPNELLTKVKKTLLRPPRASKGKGKAEEEEAALDRAVRKTVLLAEEDDAISAGLVDVFVHSGFEVVLVTGGAQVVEKAIIEKPDILVMRLVMKGMNGDAVAAILKNLPSTRDIPVLLYEDSGALPRDRGATSHTNVTFISGSDSKGLLDAVREQLYEQPRKKS